MITFDNNLIELQVQRVIQVQDLGILFTLPFNSRPKIDYTTANIFRGLGLIWWHSLKITSPGYLQALNNLSGRSVRIFFESDETRTFLWVMLVIAWKFLIQNMTTVLYKSSPTTRLQFRCLRFDGKIDAPGVLKLFYIRISSNIRFQSRFYPLCSWNI